MQNFKATKLVSSITLALAGASFSFGSAMAQETITLKVADWTPVTHTTQIEGIKAMMAKATELSKGRLQFQLYPSEQLGKAKDMQMLAQSGVADIVNIAPAYITEKFPLSSVVELPAIYEGACLSSYAMGRMLKPGAVLHEQEFKPNGLRALVVATLGAYRLMTANKKINKLSDYSGLKLRTAGGPMDQAAAALGAVSIRMPGPDVLPSLSRGTLDGLFWPLQSVKPWGLTHNLKYWTPNIGVGSFTMIYAISERSWKKIPPDLQKVLVEAGEFATKNHCEFTDNAESKTIEELKAAGLTPVPVADADVKAMEQKFRAIYTDWAQSLDQRNRPGTKVLETLQAELKK